MKRRCLKVCSVVLCCVFSAITGTAQANRALPARVGQMEASMAKVRLGKTVDARTEAAKRLATLTKKMGSNEATATLVSDITSLLDSPDDSVRYWVEIALGNLGPAAKTAAPKLQEMLPKAACLSGVITSASGIRYALIRMGLKLPPPAKCEPVPIAG
jgi:HEAT repeat protein